MKVKDVIVSALTLLGRSELSAALSNGDKLDGEGEETVNTLLYCFNAVEDEVARKFMPLTALEEMMSPDCKFYYVGFKHLPVKIKRVFIDGEEVTFEVFTQYVAVNASKITVEYEYAPTKKNIDGTSDFNLEVSEYLLALGAASEYCLINGEIEAAEIWEEKYRAEIDAAQRKLPAGGTIPPRRWV